MNIVVDQETFEDELRRAAGTDVRVDPNTDLEGRRCLQVDHREPAGRDGPTDVANSDAYCGFHNRTKERGFRPVRNADGTWTIHRPGDDGPITAPV